MLIILGISLIGAIIGVVISIRDYRGIGDRVVGFLFGGMFGFIIGLAITLIMSVAIEFGDFDKGTTTTLASLRNYETSTGTFFLGCGNIGSDPHIFYVTHNWASDGAYSLHSINAGKGDVFIYEEDRKDGVMIVKTQTYKKNWHYLVMIFSPNTRTEFHIPMNSITRQFSVK